MAFDGERAHFWLKASFVGVILLIVVGVVSVCALYAAEIVAGSFVCDKKDRLLELLMLAYGVISLRTSDRREP